MDTAVRPSRRIGNHRTPRRQARAGGPSSADRRESHSAHVAGVDEPLVEGERLREGLRRLSFPGSLDVGMQGIAEIRVRTAIGDQGGPLMRRLAAEIGHALVGDDDLNRMLAVVGVRNKVLVQDQRALI